MNRGSLRICKATKHLQHLMASKRPRTPLHDFVQPPTQGRVLLAARLAHLHSKARRTRQKLARSGLTWLMAASRRSVSASRSCCLGRRRAPCWSAGPTRHPAPPLCRQTPSAASLHRGWLPFLRISRPQCIQNLIIQHGRHKLLSVVQKGVSKTLLRHASGQSITVRRQGKAVCCWGRCAARREDDDIGHARLPTAQAAQQQLPLDRPGILVQPPTAVQAGAAAGVRQVHAAADNDESDYGRYSTPRRSLPAHIAWQGSDVA